MTAGQRIPFKSSVALVDRGLEGIHTIALAMHNNPSKRG